MVQSVGGKACGTTRKAYGTLGTRVWSHLSMQSQRGLCWALLQGDGKKKGKS
jgi:hypothetical protein